MVLHVLTRLWSVLIPRALAQRTLSIGGLGANIDFPTLQQNLVGLYSMTIGTVCTVLFLIGAFYMVTSTGSPDRLGKGQKLMLESLLGLAITLGAYAILRTFYALIY